MRAICLHALCVTPASTASNKEREPKAHGQQRERGGPHPRGQGEARRGTALPGNRKARRGLRIAREFGDISENSEYDDAKNEQAFLENRIAEINSILSNAKIVASPKRGNRVVIGSTVTLEDEKGRERVFTIVGGAEADSANGKISNDSPVGAACLGKKKGDVVEYEGPTGRKMKFTLTSVGRK